MTQVPSRTIGPHEEALMTHWHEVNPWWDRVVYVPLERLAECAAGGTVEDIDGKVKPYDVAFVLKHWHHFGKHLDAYILPQPGRIHSIGVRYGAAGHQYLSPHNTNPENTQALLDEYRRPS